MMEAALLVLGIVTVGYLLLILVYAWGWSKLPTPTDKAFPPLPLSIIIPARNEAGRINACLDALLKQDYPLALLDIIVVDDESGDDTVAEALSLSSPQVRVLHSRDAGSIPAGFVAFKKRALAWGIEHAQYEHLITVDADCTFPSNWAQQINTAWQYHPNVKMLVLPVVMNWHAGSALRIFQALDFLSLQAITAAAHGLGVHGMCNGANLSFRKEAFHAVGGYLGIDHRASGDDMLLLQKIENHFPNSVAYVNHPGTIARTEPAESWWAFLQQRIRWASKADAFQEWQIKAVLILVYSLNLLLVAGLFTGIGQFITSDSTSVLYAVTLAWSAKTIIEIIFLIPVARFLGERNLLFYFPLAQIPHSIYTVLAGTLSWFTQYQWKGRQLH